MAGGGSAKEENYWPGFVDALSNVVLTLVFVLVVFVFALVITTGKVKQQRSEVVEKQVAQTKADHARIGELEAEVKGLSGERDRLSAELAAARDARDKIARLLEQARAAPAGPDGTKGAGQTDAAAPARDLASARGRTGPKADTAPPSLIPERHEIAVPPAAKGGDGTVESPLIAAGEAIVVTFPRNVVTLDDTAKADLGRIIASHRGRIGGARAMIDAYPGAETYSEGRRMAYFRALSLRNLLIEGKIVAREAIVITTKSEPNAGDGRVELRFVRP